MKSFASPWVVCSLLAVLTLSTPIAAQTIIHSQVVSTPGGSEIGLFEVSGGVVSQLPTGLTDNLVPSLSDDGRFVLISAADPAFPNEASGDLFEFDRNTSQRRKVIDNSTTTQPDGTILFSTPQFSSRSPDNQQIALATQLGATPSGGVSLPRTLNIYRASDGFELDLVEIGNAATFDFFSAEFAGSSWADNSTFVTPAYLNITTNLGAPAVAVGLVQYAFNSGTNTYERAAQITTPTITNLFTTIETEFQILPVFSPDKQKIAFFSVTHRDPFLTTRAIAELATVNANGTNRTSVVEFAEGLYPIGVAWSSDGSQLVFAVATQPQIGSQFPPGGEPTTAILRVVAAAGGTPSPVAGAPHGFFPSVVPEPGVSLALAIGGLLLTGLRRGRLRSTLRGWGGTKPG